MPMTSLNPYTPTHAGCYVDGVSGTQVLLIATRHGWSGERETPDSDYYDDAIEEATDFMNSNYPVEGCWWGWCDGDWGLWPDDAAF